MKVPQAGHPAPESLAGTVERVTFQSGETGFSVLKVKVKNFRDLVAVVGIMPSVTAGEWIEATGLWVNDREHGQQFKVEIFQRNKKHFWRAPLPLVAAFLYIITPQKNPARLAPLDRTRWKASNAISAPASSKESALILRGDSWTCSVLTCSILSNRNLTV